MQALKACPHWQLCCHFRQQIVAENGNNLLPFLATIIVANVDRPLGGDHDQLTQS